MVVRDGLDLMIITENGITVRQAVSGVSRLGRATQGVILMRPRDGDRVSAVTLVDESGDPPIEQDLGGTQPAAPEPAE